MGRGHHLLFCRTLWSCLRLHSLPGMFPRNHRILAIENDVDQEGSPCDREAAEASVYGSPRPLPV